MTVKNDGDTSGGTLEAPDSNVGARTKEEVPSPEDLDAKSQVVLTHDDLSRGMSRAERSWVRARGGF